MADWTDGPEYAPLERPDGFVVPDVDLLPAGAPAAAPAGRDAPAAAPAFTGPDAAPALADLGAGPGETRDPAAPFAVVATPLTTAAPRAADQPGTRPLVLSGQPDATAYVAAAGSTTGQAPQAHWAPPTALPASAPVPNASPWGAAHAHPNAPRPQAGWAPQQPFVLPDAPVGFPGAPPQPPPSANPQGFPTSDADRWYAGYGQAPPPAATRPVTVPALVDGAHPAVLGCLAGGALAPWIGLGVLSIPLLLVAWVLAGRLVRYHRARVQQWFSTIVAGSLVLGLLGSFDTYLPLWLAVAEAWSGWAQVACWLLLVAVPLLVGNAIRRGEAPEQ